MQLAEEAALRKARQATMLFAPSTLGMTDAATSNEWTKRSAAPGTLPCANDRERGEMPHGCNGGIHISAPLGASIAAPAQLQQFACCDARGRAGILWIHNGHVAFSAAGGARVVMDVRRIKGIDMPQPSSWLQRRSTTCMLRLRLLGRPDVCESFFGFTDRAKVANEIVSHSRELCHSIHVASGRSTRR